MIKGRQEKVGTLQAFDYGRSYYEKRSLTTSLNGGLDTPNRVSTTVNGYRYYLYKNASGNYAVLCLDDDDIEVFDFDTSTSMTNHYDHALLVKPNGRLAIFARYYDGVSHDPSVDGIRIYTLDDNAAPTTVSTESESNYSWLGTVYGSHQLAFEQHGNVIHIAMCPVAGTTTHHGIIYTQYRGSLNNRYWHFSMSATAIEGDIRFGDAKPNRYWTPLYLPVPDFTNSIDGSDYSMLRFMVGASYELATLEDVFGGDDGFGTGLNKKIVFESLTDLDGGETLGGGGGDEEYYAAFADDIDHILCSSYYNKDNILVEGLTKHDVYATSTLGTSYFSISDSISTSKKPAFYHLEDDIITIDMVDYTTVSDAALEFRVYTTDNVSTARSTTSISTAHNATGSTSTPFARYNYESDIADTVRYASAANEMLSLGFLSHKGFYLKDTQDIIDEAVDEATTAAVNATFPFRSFGWGDSTSGYDWQTITNNVGIGIVSVFGNADASVSDTEYIGGGDSTS